LQCLFNMNHWILPSLSDILTRGDEPLRANSADHKSAVKSLVKSPLAQQVRAEREWAAAIAAVGDLLRSVLDEDDESECQGLVLSGPTPVLSQTDLLTAVSTWSFTTDSAMTMAWLPFQLPPAYPTLKSGGMSTTLPLFPADPLAQEQFCLVSTAGFSLVLLLSDNADGQPTFQFFFDPVMFDRAWQTLRYRIMLMSPGYLGQLDALVKQFPPVVPAYQTVTQFSHLLMAHLSDAVADAIADTREVPDLSPFSPINVPADVRSPVSVGSSGSSAPESPDIELLQAIAHEVRTPLATIRTLTRSLLRRPELTPDVVKRLDMIDRECSEQIDRFGLIFRAVELETSVTNVTALTVTSLTEVLQQSIPRWQKQASQRSLTLDVILPQQLPTVVSDPTMLDQALTSLIDRSARSLPSGSHILVEVSLAGNQLKLQLQSQGSDQMSGEATCGHAKPFLKSLGQLLMFQPETGSLSLNMAVTKNLFHALGGKLIVRERPEQGEVFTIFLPLELNRREAGADVSVLDRQPIING
jgi:hypothetical protein